MKTILLKFFLVVAGTLSAIAILECAVSISGIAPRYFTLSKGRFKLSDNAKIGYEPIPDVEYTGDSLDFYQYRGKSNTLGFRGPYYSSPKTRDTKRIIVIGDSVTEGIGIDDYKNVYTNILEDRMKNIYPATQVFNFGVSGYNTQQEVETLKKRGLKLSPDLVIVGYSLNDTDSPYFWLLNPLLEQENKSSEKPLSRKNNPLLKWSSVYRLLYATYLQDEHKNRPTHFEQYDTGNTVSEYMHELKKLSEKHKFNVLIVVFPRFDKADFKDYPYSFFVQHAEISQIAKSANLPILDLLEPYRACARKSEESMTRDPLHPSEAGHLCAGEAIAEYIQKHSVLAES